MHILWNYTTSDGQCEATWYDALLKTLQKPGLYSTTGVQEDIVYDAHTALNELCGRLFGLQRHHYISWKYTRLKQVLDAAVEPANCIREVFNSMDTWIFPKWTLTWSTLYLFMTRQIDCGLGNSWVRPFWLHSLKNKCGLNGYKSILL